MEPKEIIRWLETLQPDSTVAIDEGGLMLIELNAAGSKTRAYLEIGEPSDPLDDFNYVGSRHHY